MRGNNGRVSVRKGSRDERVEPVTQPGDELNDADLSWNKIGLIRLGNV